MGRQLVVRLIQTLVSLVGMSLLIFALVRASGDPVDLMRTPSTTEAEIANIRAQWGLDKSYAEQYWLFVSGMVQGDLGKSLIQRRPVTTMIGDALPSTLGLSGIAFVIAMSLALVLGVLSATRRDTWLDNGVKFLAVLGQALPGFWVGIVAIYVFAVYWHLLPTSGMGTPAHFVLPVLTLAFAILPGMMRLVRSSMLDVLGSEYVKLARIKGLPERTVIWKHALRNALITPLTAAGAIFANLITSAVILETVFAWPGVGRLMVTGVSGRDFPVVQGVTMMVAVVTLLINLLVDIAYAYVDPRIRS
jgi:ABC-type dipeptide/oligopeptide/nickel transport system permease component